ncbi:hypothetical protein ACTS91_00145 [Empedobacter falsenii]
MNKLIEILDSKLEKNMSKFQCGNNDYRIIPDGIVNTKKYISSSIKILWILKEVNSEDLDWDLRDALNGELKIDTGLKKGWEKTFTPVVYTTLGILNNEDWHTMGDFTINPDLIDCLQEIAYINIKKIGGGSKALNNEIKAFYEENKDALHEQIQLINPDIIIFGNTMNYFDVGIFDKIFGELEVNKENNNLHVYSNKNHLLLHAYHPNNRRISNQEYCDSIIKEVRNWKKY